jgi:hypothetical protein
MQQLVLIVSVDNGKVGERVDAKTAAWARKGVERDQWMAGSCVRKVVHRYDRLKVGGQVKKRER